MWRFLSTPVGRGCSEGVGTGTRGNDSLSRREGVAVTRAWMQDVEVTPAHPALATFALPCAAQRRSSCRGYESCGMFEVEAWPHPRALFQTRSSTSVPDAVLPPHPCSRHPPFRAPSPERRRIGIHSPGMTNFKSAQAGIGYHAVPGEHRTRIQAPGQEQGRVVAGRFGPAVEGVMAGDPLQARQRVLQ